MSKSHPLISRRCASLKGELSLPGDKSISHRAVMFGGIAEGETVIHGLLEGEDVLHTVAVMRALGAQVSKDNGNVWYIRGVGAAGLQKPRQTLYMGNSGTSARLLMGLLSTQSFTTEFDGDESLQKRPMERVTIPLTQMGAQFKSENGRLPMQVIGAENPKAITYLLPVASAQVKSAVLLASLNANGITTVVEKIPTRDHSENMLRAFGAKIKIGKQPNGAQSILLYGKARLKGQVVRVPADPSSAAFPIVAALLLPGSRVTLKNVGLNPRRIGLIDTLLEMGAPIDIQNRREEGGEPVGDLIVESSALKGIAVPATRAPSMIDEYPVLAMAAACANGTTRMCGLSELRVKESDRLTLIAEGLKKCGVKVDIEGDDLIVHGSGEPPVGGGTITTAMDHRIAMSFLVLGCATVQPIKIDDGSFIATSFPNFVGMMNKAGAKIEPVKT